MKMRVNKRLNTVHPSIIREMKNLADSYDDVVDFTLGEPHLFHETYELIRKGLHRRLLKDSLGYANFFGVPELKEALLAYCKEKFHQEYTMDEMIITNGVSESISAVLKVILEEGDEVIVFNPSFVLYQSNTEMNGGTVVSYDMLSTSMRIEKEKLLSLITDKTKAIILNSPCNPTGKLMTESDLACIYECIKDRPIFVISDEIYRELLFDNQEYPSISQYHDLRNRLFVMNGLSKSFAMTGWRVGYVMGPRHYMKLVGLVHHNMVASVSTVSQYGAIEALKHPEILDNIRSYYKRNRDYAYENLKPYFKNIVRPDGAFYLYLDASEYGLSSKEFAIKLLENEKVALVPGIAFEVEDSGYVRLSYCCDYNVLKEGIRRIQNFRNIL